MKKAFTLIAALAVLASASFAQTASRTNGSSMSPAAMFKAMHHKTVTPVTTTSAPKNVTSFPWTEGFENGTLTGFTFIDSDNDGFNWEIRTVSVDNFSTNSGDGVIVSASYDNDNGALTPDNWMILPAFNLPASATDFELSWYEKGQDPSYADEYYSVYISTTGATIADFGTTPALSSTATGNWVKKTVSLSSYAGQTIYIAFRHYNVTDMFYLNIDDIRVGGESAPEVTISGPSVVILGNAATFTANTGVQSVTWYVDGTQDNETGLTMNYTFTTAGSHEVVVEASNTVGSSYDTIEVTVIDCSDNDLPYTAVFGDVLGCWDTICDTNNGTPGTGWFTCAEMGLDEGQVLSMSAESIWGIFMIDMPTDNWLISPEFTMPSTGSYEVAWSVKPYEPTYAGDHYAVYVIDGSDTTLLFEETLNSNMTDYVDRMAIIPSTVSGDFQIAFRHFNCAGGYVIILDDIAIRALTAPQVTLNGPAEAENGATVTFTAVCGNAESFDWNVDGNSETETGATLTYTFTTDGQHTVIVTATNSEGSDSDTIDVVVYSCDAIDEFPYSMGFENGMRCWTMVSNDPANDGEFGISEEPYDGNYGFQFSSYSSADDYNQYLITPELTLPTNQNMMFRFMYAGFTANESFRVLASTTDNNIASFTTVLGDFVETETEWTEIGFVLPAGTKYVAINYYGNYQYYLYIDNVSIEQLTAPTVTLSGDTRVMVDNEATFTANAPLATSFSWTVDGTAVSSTTNTLTHTFTTVGNHTVEVTATNSEGSNSASMTVEVFACDHITSFPYTMDFEATDVYDCWKFIDADGDGFTWDTDFLRDNDTPAGHNGSNGMIASASYINNYGALTPDNWMILPAIDVPAGSNLYLSWYAKGQDATYSAEKYSVYVSTSSNVSSFTNAVFTETTTSEWTGHSVNLANYAGQTIYIAFRHYDVTDMFWLDIDDITISETSVGIENVNDINVAIYPNPVSSVLNVEGEGIEQVEVMDLNGRILLTSAATTLNIENLASGVYMVRVIAAEGIHVEKIVKK